MKPLLVLARTMFVGCLWSIIFIEGVRVIMLENWRFDIFWPPHWMHAWALWLSGWVIDTPKEWAFVLILVAFIPLWLTGWIALSMVVWEDLIVKTVMLPIRWTRSLMNPIKIATVKAPVIVKKKSYKEIRPTNKRTPIYDYSENSKNESTATSQTSAPAQPRPASIPAVSAFKTEPAPRETTFNHAIFNLDDEDDDFDLDFDSFEKSDFLKKNDKKKASRVNVVDEDEFEFSPKKVPAKGKNFKRDVYDNDDDEEEEFDDFESAYKANFAREEGFAKPRRNPKARYEEDDDDDRQSLPKFKRQVVDDDQPYDDEEDFEPKRNARRNDRRGGRNVVEDKKDNNRRFENNRAKERAKDMPLSENNQAFARLNNPVADVLTQRGYELVANLTVKGVMIDFAAISRDKICLCLVDKEQGDWLADEEQFNNEEPLWFSESSHRISPVRKVDLARQAVEQRLADEDIDLAVKAYVVVQAGNIINAEDMFEIWDEMDVVVTRISRGSPKEIRLFSKTVEEAEGRISTERFNTLKKIIRSIS